MKLNKIPYFKDYQLHKLPHTLGGFDEGGIPLFEPKKLNLKGEPSYHPIVIVQYALAHYNLWVENNKEEHLEHFFKCSEWLSCNYTYYEKNDIAIYYYDFDLKTPPVKAPWYSGMAQGQILSLFVRAYLLSGDNKYMELSKKIVNSFTTTIKNNGCCSYLDGHIFIQEIAHSPELFILNGALYAIIGIVEFDKISNVNEVINIDEFIKGVEALLPRFDLGFWTRYSLGMRFHFADMYYQKVHAQQLIYLGEKINNQIFSNYGIKFQKQIERNSSWINIFLKTGLNLNRALRLFKLNNILYKYYDNKLQK